MTSEVDSRISTRFFLGGAISKELRYQLDRRNGWETNFQTLKHQGEEYIGLYIDPPPVPVSKITEAIQTLKNELQPFCPKISLDSWEITIIPQVFVK